MIGVRDVLGPTTARSHRLLLVMAFAAIYLLWGSTYLAIRYAVDTLPPLLMAGTRAATAGAVLFVFVTRGRFPRLSAGHWRTVSVSGGLMFLGGHGLLCWAEQRIESGIAALVLAMIPIWMVIVGWVSGGGKPGFGTITGVVLGFTGIVVLVSPWKSSMGMLGEPAALGALIGSGFLWVCGSLYARKALPPGNVALSTAMQLLTGGVLLLLVGIAIGEVNRLDFAMVSSRSILSLVYLIVFGSLVAFSAYSWLLRKTDPVLVGTYAFVNPVVAVALGWSLGGERFDIVTVFAGAVIVIGVAVVQRSVGVRPQQVVRANSRP
ncbi:MAG: EamA family transporter [Candidatus Latescibacterota bacterium]|nr:MAG: EamA family transporter [Candidatus Latescibacterota bacterium]